jgi:hypothetical protein
LIGSANGPGSDIIFVSLYDGVFMIDLESKCATHVFERDDFNSIFPYMSFCAPGPSVVVKVVVVGTGAEDGRVEVAPLDAWLANVFLLADHGVQEEEVPGFLVIEEGAAVAAVERVAALQIGMERAEFCEGDEARTGWPGSSMEKSQQGRCSVECAVCAGGRRGRR